MSTSGLYNGINIGVNNGLFTGTSLGVSSGAISNDFKTSLVTSGLVINYNAASRASHVGNASATIWNDLSGNNNTATMTSNIGYTSTFNGGVTFPGVIPNGVVSSPNSNTNYQNDFTIQIIFNQTGGSGGLRSLTTGWLSGAFEIRLTASRTIQILRSLVASYGIFTNFTAALNTPYILAVTKRLSGGLYIFDLYINGILKSTIGNSSTNITTVTYPQLGRNGNGINNSITTPFIGNIHAFQWYSRSLTPNEIYQNYLALRPRFITSLTS